MKPIFTPKDLKIIKDLIKISRLIYLRGYTSGNSGNISGRINNDVIVIKKTGRSFLNLTPKDFIITSLKEKAPSEASTDYFIHRSIYLLNRDVKYVIHAHPPNVVSLTQLSKNLEPTTFEGIKYFGRRISVFEGPHDKLALEIDKYIDKKFVIEKGHGVYLFGEDINKLFILLEELEYTASIILKLQHLLR